MDINHHAGELYEKKGSLSKSGYIHTSKGGDYQFISTVYGKTCIHRQEGGTLLEEPVCPVYGRSYKLRC
jgi:hypothetical protein